MASLVLSQTVTDVYSASPSWLFGFESTRSRTKKSPLNALQCFLNDELPSIDCVSQLRSRLLELDLLRTWNAVSSERAFDHFLSKEEPRRLSISQFASLVDFLSDPTLDLSHIRNLTVWIQSVSRTSRGLRPGHVEPILNAIQDLHTQRALSFGDVRTIHQAVYEVSKSSLNFKVNDLDKRLHASRHLYKRLWDYLSHNHSQGGAVSNLFLWKLLRHIGESEHFDSHKCPEWMKDFDQSDSFITETTLSLLNAAAMKEWKTKDKGAFSKAKAQALKYSHSSRSAIFMSNIVSLMPADLAGKWMENTTRVLAQLTKQPFGRSVPTIIHIWLSTFDTCAEGGTGQDAFTLNHHYRILAKDIEARHMLVHFNRIGPRAASETIMRHWVRARLDPDATKRTRSLFAEMEKRFHHQVTSAGDDEDPTWYFTVLMQTLAGYPADLGPLLNEVAGTVGESWGSQYHHRLLRRLRLNSSSHLEPGYEPQRAHGLSSTAFSLSPKGITFPLPAHAQALINRIESQLTPMSEIAQFIHRGRYKDTMCLQRIDTRRFDATRLQIIDAIAIAIAKDKHRTPSQAFKTIWECCYRPVSKQGVPVSSTVIDAIVHAGITRPLEDKKWVSTTQIRVILNLVKDIEGKEKAAEIEEKIWEWRGEMIQLALKKLKEKGISLPPGSEHFVQARSMGLV